MGILCSQDKKRKTNQNPNITINNNYNNCIINNRFNNIENINRKIVNGVCCPSCGEPTGNNFGGDGKNYFNCMRCGDSKYNENCFKCKNCNSIFCTQCPHKGYSNGTSCPSCNEPAGSNFGGGGKKYFNCMSCGDSKYNENCFKCKNCNSIFCTQCPHKGYSNGTSCPSCNEPAGSNFGGGGKKYFNCMSCGDSKYNENCFKCK